MNKVTIKSIASDLGLSRNTVAMALKGDERVAEATRVHIIQYAASVGYQVALPAPTCVTQQEKILIVRRPDWTAYWDRVVGGISQAAGERNFVMNITVVTQEDINAMRLPNGYEDDITGIFFLHKFGEEYNQLLLQGNKIGVFLDRSGYSDTDFLLGDVIKTEGTRSMMAITTSLIEQGLTRIAYLCPYAIGAETFDDRFHGFVRAMRIHNIPINHKYVVEYSDITDKPAALEQALRQFLPDDAIPGLSIRDALAEYKDELPEAIVCANDSSCFKVSKILQDAGIRIPEDIAITGFDNDEYDAFVPFFTTVESNAFRLGRRMVEQFSWRRNHRSNTYETITLECKPIYRRSSEKVQAGNTGWQFT